MALAWLVLPLASVLVPLFALVRVPLKQRISPDLSEGDGCKEYVEAGDALTVRYDPEGAAASVTEGV
ncbi:hypothetical protein ACWCXB_05030 [Streptomyces sp. NPDC001514]